MLALHEQQKPFTRSYKLNYAVYSTKKPMPYAERKYTVYINAF